MGGCERTARQVADRSPTTFRGCRRQWPIAIALACRLSFSPSICRAATDDCDRFLRAHHALRPEWSTTPSLSSSVCAGLGVAVLWGDFDVCSGRRRAFPETGNRASAGKENYRGIERCAAIRAGVRRSLAKRRRCAESCPRQTTAQARGAGHHDLDRRPRCAPTGCWNELRGTRSCLAVAPRP